jgi:hypothetical protein
MVEGQKMTDDEIDKAWSFSVAELAAAALVEGGIVEKDVYARARDIISEEILVRLVLGDRPDRANWRFNLN